MADCSSLFKAFDVAIKLTGSKKDELRNSRDSLRDKVRKKFKAEGRSANFHRQGSFAMNTIIMPKNGDYDIDDGIYLLVEEKPSETITKLHKWVVEAARDHTQQEPDDRDPCVRVLFKDGHHVDLVIYYKKQEEHPMLAHKSQGWIVSDPKEFVQWFNKRVDKDGQLKRIIRYLKAWRDELQGEMPSGLCLTILATNHVVLDDRDDVAFLSTMKNIKASLDALFMCMRPTTPNEDLFTDYAETRKKYFLDRLASFIRSGEQAIAETNQIDACKKWKRHFGERFPCDLAEDEIDEAKTLSAPAFIRSDARSA